MNEAETVEVDLNVLAERAAKIPEKFVDSRYVFLPTRIRRCSVKCWGETRPADRR
jgi:hypothetical protein